MKPQERIAELKRMEQGLIQQVILMENSLLGLKEQLASVRGGVIELEKLKGKVK